MSALGILKILILSFVIALVGRLGYFEFSSWRNERLTTDLCAAAGNYLETGNLRAAFESLEYGVARISAGKTCVSVIDNGRSFAPNCVDEKVAYQTVTCHADANKGVRAQVMYPKGELLGRGLLAAWAIVAIFLSLSLLLAQTIAAYVSAQLVQELQASTFGKTQVKKRSVVGRIFDGILERTGIRAVIQAQAKDFEQKISAYEFRLVSEAEIRKQREAEVERSRNYAEKIKQIRHDIRSPLSGLLAVQEAVGASDDLLSSTIASVVHGLRELVEGINHLDAEEASPSLTVVEVVAEEALRSTRLKFQKAKNVTIRLQYDREKLSAVFAVPSTLRRIFENILENAFDAVSSDGRIEISVSGSTKACRVVIEDNGCGIAAEQLPRLFQEGATFGKVGGTGLGLYHAKRSLQSWGGEISFEPGAEGGARFVLSIPLAQIGVLYKAPPSPPREALVIDDDPKVANLVSRQGYKIAGAAGTFDEGAALLRWERPAASIVLIDQDLGGRKGTDLIAETPDRRNFYLCTNDFDSEDVVRRAREVGVSIIPKSLLLTEPLKPATGANPNAYGRV